MRRKNGFTLIELLVVIAIIGVLASVVMASLNASRAKARDAKKKANMNQLAQAMEMYYNDSNQYMGTWGWFENYGSAKLLDVSPLTPTYIPKVANDAINTNQYWRKDYTGYACLTLGDPSRFAFYTILEKPSAADLATITGGDSFDQCVRSTWGMNYKVGN